MGFVYNLHCELCGFTQEYVTIGLSAGSTLTIIQDQESGLIRQLSVVASEIENHSEKTEFSTDDEWIAAMDSFVKSVISETEKQISPHEAFCPKCRTQLLAESVGIS